MRAIRYGCEIGTDGAVQYCNDLSMTIELDSTLAQAEVLFLSFQQSTRVLVDPSTSVH